MNPAGRCPACGSLLPGRDRQRGGRKLRYCSGACKAKAYRDRQRSGTRPGDAEPPLPPTAAARHARATEIRRQIIELTAAMADTASGQQALFASPGTTRPRPARRHRPDPAPPGHRARHARHGRDHHETRHDSPRDRPNAADLTAVRRSGLRRR